MADRQLFIKILTVMTLVVILVILIYSELFGYGKI